MRRERTLPAISRQGFGDWERLADARRGGRSWWAHIDSARINIEPTFQKEEIEELMNIRGIGEKSFLKLKPLVMVTAEKADRPADKP
jgi:hypothetical protein